jgi:hypothetical protein
MTRRNVIVMVLAVALVVGGAIVSFVQSNRVDDEAAGANLFPEGTLEPIVDCPYGDASCVLGQGIERALQLDKVDAVMEFGAARFYICPGPDARDVPSPLCDGVATDEGRYGYPVAQLHRAASVVEPDALRATLQAFVDAVQPGAKDDIGSGDLKLYSFSCTQAAFPAQNLSCAKEGIILSAILQRDIGAQRELLVFWAQGGFQGRTLPFTEVWEGSVEPDEAAILFKTGGSLPDIGSVHVIDQSLRP